MNNQQVLDPVTFEILEHRLFQILTEARYGLMRVSGSAVVCETGEAMYSLYNAEGLSSLTAAGILLHIAGSEEFLKKTLSDYAEDPGIFDGDMFFFNDPYIGGIHAADQWIGTPVFHEGRIMCWLGCMTHTAEIGALDPGGMSPRAREIFHEGLRLPGLKIVEKGKIRPDVMNLLKRSVRDPGHIALDTHAKIAGLNIGKRRILEVIKKYGPDVVSEMMDEMIATSKRMAQAKLSELADGSWYTEIYADHDGVEERKVKVALRMTKTGDRMRLDFTGTDAQSIGPVNCTYSGLVGSTFVALASILFWDVPWNHGMMEAVEIVAPKGSLVNCEWPAPCAMAPNNPGNIIAAAVTTLAGRMLITNPKYHDDINAAWRVSSANPMFGGKNQYGIVQGTLLMDTLAGGSGAGIDRDGADTGANQKGPETTISDVEASELSHPFLYLYRREAIDNGGPGKYRGGAGVEVGYMIHNTSRLYVGSTASGINSSPAVGLFGGYPGASTRVVYALNSNIYDLLSKGVVPYNIEEIYQLLGLSGQITECPSYLPFQELHPGDIVAVIASPAGGLGDPLERDPSLVLRDIEDRMVSLQVARDVYGVVLNKAGNAVDLSGTLARRELLKGYRRKKAQEPLLRFAPNPEPQPNPLIIHESLTVEGEGLIRCTKCGGALGPASENYKHYALKAETDPSAAGGPRPKKPEVCVYNEYYCPYCLTLLDVEPLPAGSPPLWDIHVSVK